MVVSCEIEFDNNPQGTYFTGQVVSGSIIIKTDKPKDVKGLFTFLGMMNHLLYYIKGGKYRILIGKVC